MISELILAVKKSDLGLNINDFERLTSVFQLDRIVREKVCVEKRRERWKTTRSLGLGRNRQV